MSRVRYFGAMHPRHYVRIVPLTFWGRVWVVLTRPL